MNDPPGHYYKTVKIPLKSIIRHQYEHNIILENVNKVTKIYTNTLQFIKLYYLDELKKTDKFLTIDENLVLAALKVICDASKNEKEQKEEIQNHYNKMKILYDTTYKTLNIYDNLDYDGLATLFQYLAIEIVTTYENNVRLRYHDYLVRCINSFFGKKDIIDKIKEEKISNQKQKEKISEYCKILNNIKYDVMALEKDKTKYKSDKMYHSTIEFIKSIALPNKQNYNKDSIKYDIKSNPMDYFSCMFKLLKFTELCKGDKYNLFPLKNSVIPRHIKLDTTTIINLFMECDKSYYKNNIAKENTNIWEKFFKLNKKVFRKRGYKFNDSIVTDGVSCCILFVKEKYYKKTIPKSKKNKNNEQYIDELEEEEYERLKNKNIIAIDPNKGDLLYCVDDVVKERNHLRYTQDQRRKETKIKKYKKIREKYESENKIDGKTISELESELSKYDRTTLNMSEYIEYLREKNKINKKVWKYYNKEILRKLNLNVYLNTLRSEQKLMNNMKETFGSPKNTIICIGDWEQKGQMKFKEPTKGKGFRDTFRRAGYEVYLVDEYGTSCRCSVCGGECETFRKRENPRPYKEGTITVHGLLSCKNCKVLWNRDENSSNNIYMIAKHAINGLERPLHLQRNKIK